MARAAAVRRHPGVHGAPPDADVPALRPEPASGPRAWAPSADDREWLSDLLRRGA
jgi:hypothetical protein